VAGSANIAFHISQTAHRTVATATLTSSRLAGITAAALEKQALRICVLFFNEWTQATNAFTSASDKQGESVLIRGE
jgi:hypothetical protein